MLILHIGIDFHDGSVILIDQDPRQFKITPSHLYLGDDAPYPVEEIKRVHIQFLDQQKGQASDGAAVSTPASSV